MQNSGVELVQEMASKASKDVRPGNILEYKVCGDYVLVAPVTLDTDTKNNTLIKPRQYEDKNHHGVVVGVGPGRFTDNGMLIDPGVTVGDVILYGEYSYTTFRVDGYDCNIIRTDDIISVLPSP